MRWRGRLRATDCPGEGPTIPARPRERGHQPPRGRPRRDRAGECLLIKRYRRWTDRLQADVRSLAAEAVATLRKLVSGPDIPPSVRLRASLAILQAADAM